MVTTEVAQLSQECNAWRETLRSLRDEFHQMKQQLQQKAKSHTHKEDLLQVEHLDNQLHIQLINIHDLKQAIKQHDKKVLLEVGQNESGISEATLLDHERLFDAYTSLDNTLQDIRHEYDLFTNRTQ
jgi:predicted RNase H-like nuclease (RuvC/YqgF family)